MEAEPFYIPRLLKSGDQTLTQEAFCAELDIAIVLGEPGGGKSRLLTSLATMLSATSQRASVFRHQTQLLATDTLILDALDEVSRIDVDALHALVVKAHESGARRFVLASRSGEWEEAVSRYIHKVYGREPKTYRLIEFSAEAIQQIFEHLFPGESFLAFEAEAARYNLTPLLANPQLLEIFGKAFVRGRGRFGSKDKIYSDAIDQMASENNRERRQRDASEPSLIVRRAEEVFAKLILSGQVGVASTKTAACDLFPWVADTSPNHTVRLSDVLNTHLFKSAPALDCHEPVHRIVQEYCAASFLVRKLEDASDRFTLKRCLAVIAPNGTTRDDLRGVLAWLAALGGESIQCAAIGIDPYAVLSNGDPSKLTTKSKRQLLASLEALAQKDPYFRRSDKWRTFSASDFFDNHSVGAVRPSVVGGNGAEPVRTLVLELMRNSSAVLELTKELCEIVVSRDASSNDRNLALIALLSKADTDIDGVCAKLVDEASYDSLKLVAEIIATRGVVGCGRSETLNALRKIACLYDARSARTRSTAQFTYFINRMVRKFDIRDCTEFLDTLSAEIICSCGASEVYRCKCRFGKSKVLGVILDRFFALNSTCDPESLWAWCRRLCFNSSASAQQNRSVEAIGQNDQLRRAVQRIALSAKSSADEVRALAYAHFRPPHGHSGLYFREGDIPELVQHAFVSNDHTLWEAFLATHNPYSDQKGLDLLRRRMRLHARQDTKLQEVWFKAEKLRKRARDQSEGRFRRSV